MIWTAILATLDASLTPTLVSFVIQHWTWTFIVLCSIVMCVFYYIPLFCWNEKKYCLWVAGSQDCTYPDAATWLKATKPDTAGSLTRAFHNSLFFISISILICFTFF